MALKTIAIELIATDDQDQADVEREAIYWQSLIELEAACDLKVSRRQWINSPESLILRMMLEVPDN